MVEEEEKQEKILKRKVVMEEGKCTGVNDLKT
jgi:hypothetical protein